MNYVPLVSLCLTGRRKKILSLLGQYDQASALKGSHPEEHTFCLFVRKVTTTTSIKQKHFWLSRGSCQIQNVLALKELFIKVKDMYIKFIHTQCFPLPYYVN